MGLGSQGAIERITDQVTWNLFPVKKFSGKYGSVREMSYAFHPEAEAEFISAINYYEERHVGLGYDFAREVYSAIQV